ncbi:MAG: hypothetical protein ACOCXG_04415 [Nanoarchaeota archaeon]
MSKTHNTHQIKVKKEHLDFLDQIRQEKGFETHTDALHHILEKYKEFTSYLRKAESQMMPKYHSDILFD